MCAQTPCSGPRHASFTPFTHSNPSSQPASQGLQVGVSLSVGMQGQESWATPVLGKDEQEPGAPTWQALVVSEGPWGLHSQRAGSRGRPDSDPGF